MPRIISFKDTNPNDSKENPIKILWRRFYSMDNFAKGTIVVSLFFIVFAVAIANTLLETRQRAEAPEETLQSPGPKVKYDFQKENEQVERRKYGKAKLSKKDLLIRDAIVAQFKDSVTGIVYQTQNVNIQYDNIADDFLAAILSPDVNLAKTEAENWLRGKGLSNDAICNLPLSYILSPTVADSFPQTEVFSSIPLACAQTATPTVTSIPISSVSPTCTPRPACLDAHPACKIPVTADMCPPK